MHGGVKFYRGNPAGARAYVEADHARADDYYLAEGSGIAEYYAARIHNGVVALDKQPDLDAESYERWVHGYDTTGAPKGQISNAARAVRFVEVVVNGPKSWSIAAALHPEIAAAYDAAQGRAAREIITWLTAHSTTRVGPRGLQVQIPVESGLEAAVITHYTSRAGDPHRHLHLQINAKVFAAGKWRALHTVGIRHSIEAINGIGHAAVMCDPEFRTALAAHGYTLNDTGEITQLAEFVPAFSRRATQIQRNVDRYETDWRAEHPGEEPGPSLSRSWDRRAWADARPDKGEPGSAADMVTAWTAELTDAGFTPPTRSVEVTAPFAGPIDVEAAAELILSRLAITRSGWNQADIRGQAETVIAASGVVAEPRVRMAMAAALTAQIVRACRTLIDEPRAPEDVRTLTSPEVLRVEAELNRHFATRAVAEPRPLTRLYAPQLDPDQHQVASAIAGSADLLLVEGAAGAGKTTTLAAAAEAVAADGRRMVLVTPTKKAAIAASKTGAIASSAHWLIHQHGYRWDQDGRWTRAAAAPDTRARLLPGDVLVVDEAGMLDQPTALALLTIANETRAQVVLVGDRHQLPAVGRGGVLDLAARWTAEKSHLELESIHRFTDPDYAALSLKMRTGIDADAVFDQLYARGDIAIYQSEVERNRAMATQPGLLIADTTEHVRTLNSLVRELKDQSSKRTEVEVLTNAGEAIGVGDLVATRRNDTNLGVANRDTWTVTAIGSDGGITVTGRSGIRHLPPTYLSDYVELAHATTAHGAQGDTVDQAHFALGENTSGASLYVGMTRGRQHNTLHVVAADKIEAKQQFASALTRDRADLGPAKAAERAWDDIDIYGLQRVNDVDQAAAERLRRGQTEQRRTPPSPGKGIGR